MPQTFAIISDEKNRYRAACKECMKEKGMTTAWGDCTVSGIVSVSSFVNTYIVLLPEEWDLQFHQICFFLKDYCLEEEKQLYLYGTEEMLTKVRAIIPKLFISGMFNSDVVSVKKLVEAIEWDFREVSSELPSLLLVDEDKRYFRQLSLMLEDSFSVTISAPDVEDLVRYLQNTDIMLMNVNMKVSILQFGILFEAIERRVKTKRMKLMYITDTKAEQKYINSIQLSPTICFAKEIPIEKIAFYIKKHYSYLLQTV